LKPLGGARSAASARIALDDAFAWVCLCFGEALGDQACGGVLCFPHAKGTLCARQFCGFQPRFQTKGGTGFVKQFAIHFQACAPKHTVSSECVECIQRKIAEVCEPQTAGGEGLKRAFRFRISGNASVK